MATPAAPTIKVSILVPDELHINRRNFESFFKFVETNRIPIHFATGRKDWVGLYGNYEGKYEVLKERIALLSLIPADDLFNFTAHEVNLFKVARAECLSRVAVRDHWFDQAYPTNLRAVFDRLYANDKTVLVYCMAAAMDWIDYWVRILAGLKDVTHCCMFSGSMIYQRSLIEILRYTPIKVMVMESFFTGNDYYCEEKYEHIANNCDIRHDAVYQALGASLPTDPNEYDKERVKAINKVLLMKNKNVQQPEDSEPLDFSNAKRPLLVVLGQVVNDYSVLEYRNLGMSTVTFYKELIRKAVKAGYNVAFKAHPWELKKTNVMSAFTKERLAEFVEHELSKKEQGQVRIFFEYNLKQLMNQATFVVGLNSQSLLEASFDGIKPVQFGNAFYGRRGFTHDYTIEEIDDFLADAQAQRIHGTLTLAEYRQFEEWLVKALQVQLISVNPSGASLLLKRFTPRAMVALVSPSAIKAAQNPTPAPAAAKPAAPAAAKPAAPAAKPAITLNPAPAPAAPAAEAAVAEETTEGQLVALTPATPNERKIRKLTENPRKFFADSNSPVLRAMRHFFKAA